jgi:GT2 family glycosyltransferase
MPYWPQDTIRPVDILSGCFWLSRKEALLETGLLDETFFMYGEDMDWCKRFRVRGWDVVFNPTAEAIHHGGASSANAPIEFFIEKQRADLQYWRKHHGWLAQRCYFAISCLHHLIRIFGHCCALWCGKKELQETHLKVARGYRCLRWLLSSNKHSRHDWEEKVCVG